MCNDGNRTASQKHMTSVVVQNKEHDISHFYRYLGDVKPERGGCLDATFSHTEKSKLKKL